MVLYYAFGGGLGHLIRANAFINTMGYNDDFLILTSSNYSDFIFESKNVIKLPNDSYSKPKELKTIIENIIKTKKIDSFYIDSFPAGINGELNNLQINDCKLHYIARLLNWTNYLPYLLDFNLTFETTFIIENLFSEHLNFIKKHTVNYQHIQLNYPNQVNIDAVNQVLAQIEYPVWLIVHSGSINELKQLYDYAVDIAEMELVTPHYLIIGQTVEKLEVNSGTQINYYPATDFFPFVERIFTACGYNSFAQTLQYIDKHYFIPFHRKFDDQFIRAKNRKLFIGRS